MYRVATVRNLDAWYDAFDIRPGQRLYPRAKGARARLVRSGNRAMRVTVCELPHEPTALNAAWAALCEHTARESSELVLLPELAMMDPVWDTQRFDVARWSAAEQHCNGWLTRVSELRAANVVGTRPIAIDGRLFNEGYLATDDG
jgi:hypothetical protein